MTRERLNEICERYVMPCIAAAWLLFVLVIIAVVISGWRPG
mgnify:CR=1 FL=1